MTPPLVRVENLSVAYPIYEGFFRSRCGVVEALCEANFRIEPGQIVGVIGESGSGKSTLARCLVCLTRPTAGRVIFSGTEVSSLSQAELAPLRKSFQIVFQNPAESLNKRKTIGDTFAEVLSFHHIVIEPDAQEDYCRQLLQKVGLDEKMLTRYPHELSIGQQARICLARAICTKPRLLVLDECISALDISLQAQVLNLLLSLCQETKISYLFISHDLSAIRHLADYVLVMCQGRIIEQGSLEEVFENPTHPYTKQLLASALPTTPAYRFGC